MNSSCLNSKTLCHAKMFTKFLSIGSITCFYLEHFIQLILPQNMTINFQSPSVVFLYKCKLSNLKQKIIYLTHRRIIFHIFNNVFSWIFVLCSRPYTFCVRPGMPHIYTNPMRVHVSSTILKQGGIISSPSNTVLHSLFSSFRLYIHVMTICFLYMETNICS